MLSETEALAVKLAGMEHECGPEHGKGQYGLPAPEWCSRCHGTGHLLDASLLTKALATELAGTKCPKCGGTGDAKSGGWNCLCCHGIGYLLGNSVREPCSCSACYALGHAVCGCCAGRGWTASMDLAVWLEATRHPVRFDPVGVDYLDYQWMAQVSAEPGGSHKGFGKTPLDALLVALAQEVEHEPAGD